MTFLTIIDDDDDGFDELIFVSVTGTTTGVVYLTNEIKIKKDQHVATKNQITRGIIKAKDNQTRELSPLTPNKTMTIKERINRRRLATEASPVLIRLERSVLW